MDYSKKERIAAVARLLVTLAVTAAAGFGLAIDAEALSTVVMCALTLGCFAVSWWKNNNLSTAAIEAQAFMDCAKLKDFEPEEHEPGIDPSMPAEPVAGDGNE